MSEKRSNLAWLLFGIFLIGMAVEWMIIHGRLFPVGRSDDVFPDYNDPATRNDRSGSKSIRDEKIPHGAQEGKKISGMSAAELVDRMIALDAIVSDPRRAPREVETAILRLYELVDDMRQEEVEKLLASMTERPELDPKQWSLAAQLAEMLLERWMGSDANAAIAWAKAHDSLPMIAGILSRRDPVEAVAFIRDCKVEIGESRRAEANIVRYAANLGPEGLLGLEDVLGESGINDALGVIPSGRCREFAEKWFARMESGIASDRDMERVLQRWAEVAPHEMISWYQARPEIGGSVDVVFGLMRTLLRFHQQVGLDFAKAEFQRAPQQQTMLFTYAVNSSLDTPLLMKLAELLPENAKPTITEFSQHLERGRSPGPDSIAAAANCISDPDQRYEYLQKVLGDSKVWASKERGWSEAAINDARKKLDALPMEEGRKSELLGSFDQVAADVLAKRKQP